MPDVDNPDAVHPDDTPSDGDATAAENTARLDSLRSRWESDPTSKVYLQLAEEYRKAGRLDEAIEVLETSLEHRPRDPRGRVALARCRLELGDAAAAAELLEHVTRQDPAHVVANKLQLEAYLQLGDIDQATERLNLYRLLNDRDPELDHFVYRLERLRDAPSADAAVADDPVESPVDSVATEADESSDVITIDEAVSATPPPVESFLPDAEPAVELEMIEEPAAEEPAAEEPTVPPVEFEAVEIPTDEEPMSDEFELETVAEEDALPAEAIELAPGPELAVPTPEPAFDTLDESAAEPESPTFDDIETSPTASDEPSFDDIETSPTASDEPTFDDIETSPTASDEPTFDDIEASSQTVEEPTFDALSGDRADLAPDEPTLDVAAAETPEPNLDEPTPDVERAAADADEPRLDAESRTEGSEDLFDLAPPPTPDLDDLFGLASLTPVPAPSLDGLWGEASDDSEADSAEPVNETDATPIAPSREVATVTLGQLYLGQGHLDEAERIFREVLDRDPEHAAALDGLAEIRARAAAVDATADDQDVSDEPTAESVDEVVAEVAAGVETAEGETAEGETAEGETAAPEAQIPDPVDLDPADDEEEDTAVSQAVAIQAPPVEAQPVAQPELLDEEEEEDTAVSQAVAIQPPPVEMAAVETATEPEALDEDDEEDTAVSRAVPVRQPGDGLDAASLLADRTIDTVPEGLTAKKILVLRQYARHLRQAAEHVQ